MKSRKYLKWFAGLVLVGIGAYLFIAYDLRTVFSQWFRNDMRIWLGNHPVLAPFVYILIYVISVVLFMPGSVITLVGGAIFGPIWGTVYVSIASTSAATVAFLIARYLAADWVEEKASGKLSKIKQGIEEEGKRFLAFTRLVPIFPYNLLNYMFGLTKIDLWSYVWISWVCMLPGTFAYVYVGFAGQKVVVGGVGIKKLALIVTTALAVLILVSMLPKLIKKWKCDEFEEVIDEPTGEN